MTPASSTPAIEENAPTRTQRYLTNVLWTWMGVGVQIVAAFFLTPYIIGKLGADDAGIWILVQSVIDYYWLIDFGLRSAATKMSAEFRAREQPERLNAMLSTGVVYSTLMAAVVIAVSILIVPFAERIWHVHRPVFGYLIIIAGTSWALGMVFNIFGACVEGFQRFDLLGRIWITTTAVRATGVAIVLYSGHGLLEMGFILIGAQGLSYLLTYLTFRKVAPQVRVSYYLAGFSMLKEMASYGFHTFTTIVSTRLLNQGLPAIIAYFLPTRAVTYYMTPLRIMDYAMDGIGRVGMVTTPNATELMTKDRKDDVVQLGIYANRYCLCLFLPLVSLLTVYGFEIYKLWMWRSPGFAEASYYLLPIMVISHAAVSGQFNSVSILFGIGKHKNYSRCLLAEAIVTVGGMFYVLPRYGLLGGALLAATAMILDRAVTVCFLLCRELKISFLGYLGKIYPTPIAITAICTLLLFWLKRVGIPGRTWGQLILASILMLIPYTALTYRLCLAPHHREFLRNKLHFATAKKTEAA